MSDQQKNAPAPEGFVHRGDQAGSWNCQWREGSLRLIEDLSGGLGVSLRSWRFFSLPDWQSEIAGSEDFCVPPLVRSC